MAHRSSGRVGGGVRICRRDPPVPPDRAGHSVDHDQETTVEAAHVRRKRAAALVAAPRTARAGVARSELEDERLVGVPVDGVRPVPSRRTASRGVPRVRRVGAEVQDLLQASVGASGATVLFVQLAVPAPDEEPPRFGNRSRDRDRRELGPCDPGKGLRRRRGAAGKHRKKRGESRSRRSAGGPDHGEEMAAMRTQSTTTGAQVETPAPTMTSDSPSAKVVCTPVRGSKRRIRESSSVVNPRLMKM